MSCPTDPGLFSGARIALTAAPTRLGRILGAFDVAGRWFYTVEWDLTGRDMTSAFQYTRYTAADLTPLPVEPERSDPAPSEQLSLFGTGT